jgi:hypothetical protein
MIAPRKGGRATFRALSQRVKLVRTAVVARRTGVREVQVLIAGGGPVGMTLARESTPHQASAMVIRSALKLANLFFRRQNLLNTHLID